MLSLLCLGLGLLSHATAAPSSEARAAAPIVELPYATVIGSSSMGIDSFIGIPYAKPPVEQLRLKPPQPISSNLGVLLLPQKAKQCPQFLTQYEATILPADALTETLTSPLLQFVPEQAEAVLAQLLDNSVAQNLEDEGEDCLTVSVQRPSTATKDSKLPVVFWIFGGGFEFGSTQSNDASDLIKNSVSQGKDIMYVAVNYRIGGFGFLPGKELLEDSSTNLGLLDQRLGLEWVADFVDKFGGDPEKVTIWGESAGSISVLDQMVLYDGDFTYKGKNLFRAAIMDSGSIIPAHPVDGFKGQAIYDAVVDAADCSNSDDSLECLRSVDYETFLKAANSVPAIIGYDSVALSYVPRPDGKTLTDSPDQLVLDGKFAPIPFIIGDQEDEGTLFALFQENITTTDELITYLNTVFFPDASRDLITELVNLYPDDPSAGSPFRTGTLYNFYPQYKRIAALLGDITFTIVRRVFLFGVSILKSDVPTWSYLASYDHNIPFLGTFHASDVSQAYGQMSDFASTSIQNYYISFFNDMDPNADAAASAQTHWPMWAENNTIMNFNSDSNDIIADDFREGTSTFLLDTVGKLKI